MNINNGNYNQRGFGEPNRFPLNTAWQITGQQNGQLQGAKQALNPGNQAYHQVNNQNFPTQAPTAREIPRQGTEQMQGVYPAFISRNQAYHINNFYNQNSIRQLPANPSFIANSASKLSPKEELNAYKKRLVARLDKMPESNALLIRQPPEHQLEFYPNLLLSKFSSKGNTFSIDPFITKLNFLCPVEISENNITVRSIALMLETKNFFTHQVVQGDICDMKVEPCKREGQQYEVNASISFQSIQITMGSQKEAKEINGRNDGIKANANEFAKKHRLFTLNLEAAGFSYTFKATVFASSTSSFQIPLRAYREDFNKITELFDFLVHKKASNYQLQKLPGTPELPIRQIINIPYEQQKIFDTTINFSETKILSFIDDHLEEFKNAYLYLSKINNLTEQDFLEKLPSWKKKWEILNFGPPAQINGIIKLAQQVNYPNLLKQLFTEDFFFVNLVNFLDSDIFFGGITDNIVQLTSDMRAFSQIKKSYPDGFSTIVIGRGLGKFSDSYFFYLVEVNSSVLHHNLSPLSLEEEKIDVLAMVPCEGPGIFRKHKFDNDALTDAEKEIFIGNFSRPFSKFYEIDKISSKELTSYYGIDHCDLPFFNVSVEENNNFLIKTYSDNFSTKCAIRVRPKVDWEVTYSPIIADEIFNTPRLEEDKLNYLIESGTYDRIMTSYSEIEREIN